MNVPPLYPIEQSSEMLRVSEDFNRARLRDRTWPGVKIAGRWYMTEEQILEAITLSSTEALPPAPPSPAGLARNSRFRRRAQQKAAV